MKNRLISALGLAMMLAAAPGVAHAGNGAFMPSGETADAPFGFTEMCARDRQLCLLGEGRNDSPLIIKAAYAPAAAALAAPAQAPAAFSDERLMAMLKAVNHGINRAAIQVPDFNALGVDERWNRLPEGKHPVGDCEDIAIEKRIRLEEAGFPAERMFYAVAFLPRLGLHTVLIARLDEGDYILDSLSPHVLRWDQVHYVWLRQQVPGRPLEWTRIGHAG